MNAEDRAVEVLYPTSRGTGGALYKRCSAAAGVEQLAMTVRRRIAYDDSVDVFRSLVEHAVPVGATVAVVSRGDHELLELDQRQGWHFPQRTDGVYAGYYPADSSAAIRHLESLRDKGAEFIAFPSAALWWLDEYAAFRRHLEARYERIVQDAEAGAVYALSPKTVRPPDDRETLTAASDQTGQTAPREKLTPDAGHPTASTARTSSRHSAGAQGDEEIQEDLRRLFDVDYYEQQTGFRFETADEGLAHYLRAAPGADPHPLFDTAWYLKRNPQARASGASPLVHFLKNASRRRLDPSPYFDSQHYLSQRPAVRKEGRNPLLHYVDNAFTKAAASPNPLFDDAFYLAAQGDVVAQASTPFEQFILHGVDELRFGSAFHRNILRQAQRPTASLRRGEWQRGAVLLLMSGDEASREVFEELSGRLAGECHVGVIAVACVWLGERNPAAVTPSLVLEDYELAGGVLRPSSLRLLARSLAALRPLLAVSDVNEVIEPLGATGATVVDLSSIGKTRSVGELAIEDLRSKLAAQRPKRKNSKTGTPKIIVPASDWSVSGVNAALEGVGCELEQLGWGVEIIFTRTKDKVFESAHDEDHLPSLPHRYLERRRVGALGMWEALIAELESAAPCILFTAYDFLANSVAPALGDQVGVVAWIQADDADYYEQAYRLGRYCNALVCVSERIRRNVVALNPLFEQRAIMIHNSSVWKGDIATRRPPRGPTMRLMYSGRLVAYQKRILDFAELARALDRTGVPYEISLIGSFSREDNSERSFRRLAADHLADGRIALRGRRTREEILDELRYHDFFVLLSDFEGLPLSVVESMARGCIPVVAESRSGILELIDDGVDGVIVSGRDYDAWAKLLVALWRDRARYAVMSRRARAKVRRGFCIEQVGRQFADLFADVASEITSGTYRRPPSLHWGAGRSNTGDVLPPPVMVDPGGFEWV